MRPLKIVIIGAGSASFGLSALGSLLREPALRGSTLALVDLDASGLALVRRLADRLNTTWAAGMTIESTTDRTQVLPGADIVATAIEVGPRETLWRQDWELPLRHGIRQPYAENGGVGGFAHAARNIPPILALARDMERLCSAAPLVILSNPLPRLCRAVARYTTIRPIGLCHQYRVGYGLVASVLADRLAIPADDVTIGPETWHDHVYANLFHHHALPQRLDLQAAGLNHFTWALAVRDRHDGTDLYPLLRERFLGDQGRHEPLTRDLLALTGFLPLASDTHTCEYVPYTHNPHTKPWVRYGLRLYHWEVNERRRAERWALIEELGARGGPGLEELRQVHSEGIVEVALGLGGHERVHMLALNLPNQGAVGNLPAEAIVEGAATVDTSGAAGQVVDPLPPMVAALCRRETELVEFVVQAAATGDRETALHALALDPTVDDLAAARLVLDDLLTAQADYLPQFHGRYHAL